jgi:hypothetical protein
MAVNTQKFLPSSKSVSLAKVSQNIAKGSSSLRITESAQKNIGIISVKVIEIDKILKGTLASQKKQLDNQKRQQSNQRREQQEEKLETKPDAENGKMTMPKAPRFGIFDWIKNFIGNIILGYFAVRLVDHLPKIIPIVKFIGKATDLVLDVGGKLLDGLVTFIDIGYKAVDFSRGLVGKTFGEEALKNLDKLTSEFEKFMNLAIIVGMASADFGMDRLRRRGTEKAAEKGAGTLARRGAGRVATRTTARVGGKGAAKLTSKVGSKALKAVPFLGAGLAIVEGIMRIKDGDYVGGLLSFGSAIPVAGWAFLALDIAREFMGGQEFDKSVGRAFSGKPGLTDKQVQKRTPHMSGPSFMGLAGGGVTRGGKKQTGARRTISKGGRKGKYKRTIARKPGEVQISSPGADVGGEDKLFGVFPNPFKKVVDTFNPFKNTVDAGKNLGKSDYFGPILAITSKIILGQKPNQKDYENVGLGINLLISKGIDAGKLKGGVVAAFAEGGLVDPKALEAISEGGDISKWVADTFKQSTETNAQKTLREIQQNLKLKKEQKAPSADDMGEGIGVQVSSDSEDFWLLATAAMFENSNPQGAADVAQVIYNRTQYPAWNAPTIRKAILNPGQFQPVRQYGGTASWAAIKTKEDALRFSRTHGKTQEQLERVAAALLDKNKQSDARSFVGPRDSFRSDAYEKANNHLADETEKSRHGHTFGFEPGGALIGQFKAGRLSAAQVNANVRGDISQYSDTGTGKFKVVEYITGDRNHPNLDVAGHGLPSNYHDHIAFATVAEKEKAKRALRSAGIQIGSELRPGDPGYHGRNLAIDVPGSQWRGSGSIGSREFEGSKRVRSVLGIGQNAPRFHGGPILKTGNFFGHKGEYVIDKDSVDTFGFDLMDSINRVENSSDLKIKAPSIIERIKAISGYTDYEMPSSEVVYVPIPPSNNTPEDYSSQSSSGLAMFAGGEVDDPFKTLYQGT